MSQLVIDLTNEEFDLLVAKANGHDLEKIIKIAIDDHFVRYRYTVEVLPKLDLSGRTKLFESLKSEYINPRKPVPPDRGEVRIDTGRFRFETDEDYEDAMRAYEWNLARYEAEQATLARKRVKGTLNAFGGWSCVL